MPDKVALVPEIFKALSDYCVSQHPLEACGILLGKQMNEDGIQWVRIEGFLPVKNSSTRPEQNFELDPEAWVRHISDDRLRHHTIGVFHSHPDTPPVPSKEDLRGMWEFPVYLILSLADHIPALKSYRIASGQYREQQLIIRNGSDECKDPLNWSHPVHG